MNAAHNLALLSEDEYFDLDDRSAMKHEFWSGQIVAMAGAAPNHVNLVGQIVTALNIRLNNTPCLAGSGDLKVKASDETYVFPDVVVWCKDAQWDARRSTILLNPRILVEVLSPSTQATDRGAKLATYQSIPSLLDYLIVWPDMIQIEHYARQTETDWRFRRYLNRNQTIEFAALDLKIPASEFYRRLDVPEGIITLDPPFEPE